MGRPLSLVLFAALACNPSGSGTDATDSTDDGSPPTGGPAPLEGCDLPIDITQVGVEPAAITGFVRCNDGEIHRAQAVECQAPVPTGLACTGQMGSCDSDADCDDAPYGSCLFVEGFFAGCTCVYGCATDADCDLGQVCACGGSAPDYPGSTQCIDAGCVTDADCGGAACAMGRSVRSCGEFAELGCRTEADACIPLADECGDQNCLPAEDGDAWACEPPEVC